MVVISSQFVACGLGPSAVVGYWVVVACCVFVVVVSVVLLVVVVVMVISCCVPLFNITAWSLVSKCQRLFQAAEVRAAMKHTWDGYRPTTRCGIVFHERIRHHTSTGQRVGAMMKCNQALAKTRRERWWMLNDVEWCVCLNLMTHFLTGLVQNGKGLGHFLRIVSSIFICSSNFMVNWL